MRMLRIPKQSVSKACLVPVVLSVSFCSLDFARAQLMELSGECNAQVLSAPTETSVRVRLTGVNRWPVNPICLWKASGALADGSTYTWSATLIGDGLLDPPTLVDIAVLFRYEINSATLNFVRYNCACPYPSGPFTTVVNGSDATSDMPPMSFEGTISLDEATNLTVDVIFTGGTPPAAGVVTTLADNGPGSLRQVVADAPPGGIVTFAVTGTIMLTSGPIYLRHVSLMGPGSHLVSISGNHRQRLFFTEATAGGGTNRIHGLTLRDGAAGGPLADGRWETQPAGVAIYNTGSLDLEDCVVTGHIALGYRIPEGHSWRGGGDAVAAGIFNDGFLTLRNCTVSSNLARGDDVGEGAIAGAGGAAGILNANTLIIENSTISGNRAEGGSAGAGGRGGPAGAGGLTGGRLLVMRNSTISGNVALGGPGGDAGGTAVGGGLTTQQNSDSPGLSDIQNCTITGNSAQGGHNSAGTSGGGFGGGASVLGPTTLAGTIIAGNFAGTAVDTSDLFGPATSLGHNLIGIRDGNTIFTTGDRFGTRERPLDPLLGPLQDNGGPTLTHAPRSGSPALNRGDDNRCPLTDQRGVARPIGPHCEIGAVEIEGNSSPDLHCPATFQVECASPTGAVAAIAITLEDFEGDATTVTWTSEGVSPQTDVVPANSGLMTLHYGKVLAPGIRQVGITATDSHGAQTVCVILVNIMRDWPPVIESITASPPVLHGRGHRLVPVTLRVRASDMCSAVASRIIRVTTNERPGRKRDWKITGPLTVLLRAENRRIYTILVETTDAGGNVAFGTVQIPVWRW